MVYVRTIPFRSSSGTSDQLKPIDREVTFPTVITGALEGAEHKVKKYN